MKQIQLIDFDLKNTIESGQFFLYQILDDWYYIVQNDYIFKLKQEENILFYDGINIDEKYIKNFLGINYNLDKLTYDFKYDPYLNLALNKYRGIRVQNLDLFQTIITFVCSAASNMSKIKTNLNLISKFFGTKVIYENKVFYTFPKPGSINDLEKLKEAKTGYRAKYIFQINQLLNKNPNLLEDIKNSNYKNAKQQLILLPGVGSKVANCICLFALNHKEVFPIDTWVKQIIEKLYLKKKAKNLKEIEEYIQNNFGENKGLKQQYLFHYFRNQGF